MFRVPLKLPIEAVLPQVVAASAEGPVVLVAPPGAGKTTRVPPALLGTVPGQVWLVEPRRVAARAAARRMAAEGGDRVGERVGYQVRFDRKVGPATRLVVVTEGILLRRLQADPFLEGIDAVVFDEFHERRLDADLGLALVQALRRELRDDLRLVVMSATLDPGPVADWLGGRVVHSEGRAYPVEVERLARPDPRPLDAVVADGVRRALAHEGDVLAFLPGVREILRTADRLAGLDAEVLPLYGALDARSQDRVFSPGPRRRVVLATNLAESSLTVPRVRTVVDAGLARQLVHDPGTGLDRLETGWIPMDSADQRTGRAGREAPGRCLRLWTERQEAAMAPRQVPEVARLDLAGAVLQLLSWGERPEAFRWFEVPPAHHVDAAMELLGALGALRGDGLSPLGRRLAELPLHPRLGRMLLAAADAGHADDGAWVAALLSERDPLRGWQGPAHSDSDLLDRVDAVRAGHGHEGARRTLAQVVERLVRRVDEGPRRVARSEAMGRAVLAAWPDRLVLRRGDGDERGRMVGGKGVVMQGSAVRSRLFVAVDAQPGPEAIVRVASAVDEAWLDVEERVVTAFADGRITSRRVRAHGDLELASHPAPVDRDAAGRVLEAWSVDHLDAVLPTDPAWPQLLGRLRACRRYDPAFPEPDAAWLVTLLPLVCAGCRSVAEVQRADWAGAVRDTLGWPTWSRMEGLAPERVGLAKGSGRIDWTGPRPVLAARIQQFLGMADTPRVGGGREAVLLHLLAPSRRVQQITDDLAGFWAGSYHDVRKELRARYPKHPWPEDPARWAADRS